LKISSRMFETARDLTDLQLHSPFLCSFYNVLEESVGAGASCREEIFGVLLVFAILCKYYISKRKTYVVLLKRQNKPGRAKNSTMAVCRCRSLSNLMLI